LKHEGGKVDLMLKFTGLVELRRTRKYSRDSGHRVSSKSDGLIELTSIAKQKLSIRHLVGVGQIQGAVEQ